jgi:hypothetical protein
MKLYVIARKNKPLIDLNLCWESAFPMKILAFGRKKDAVAYIRDYENQPGCKYRKGFYYAATFESAR